jgi:hypothetical protein
VTDQIAPVINEICAEHDINGIVSYIFDGSKAGWNLETKTRASSLLRRALSWCTVLKMLALEQWSEIPAFHRGVAVFDADAATWVLEQLQEKLDKAERLRKPLVDLYSVIVLSNDASSSATTVAVSNLASILEKLLSSQEGVIPELALPCDNLSKSFRPETDIKSWNRHATDSALRLQGCLLAIRSSSSEGHHPLPPSKRISIAGLSSCALHSARKLSLRPASRRCNLFTAFHGLYVQLEAFPVLTRRCWMFT